MLARLEAAGQVVLRYAPGENPNGSLDDIAGVVNEARQRVRPDAPPRARRRPADRLDRRARPVRLARGGRRVRRARAGLVAARGARARRRRHRRPVPPPRAGTATLGPLPPGLERALALGLRAHEYELIVARLGREPDEVELAMFSLLWSEHCSYKHSKPLLRTLPTEGPRLVLGPGENAGAVDVGGGLAVAFKVESHNHPSAVEPFQGAATGVGGILRDIFAVGARPIADARLAALRRPGERALALPARPRRRGDRPLRQLDRRADGRRRGLLRGALRAELPDQRDVRRARSRPSG